MAFSLPQKRKVPARNLSAFADDDEERSAVESSQLAGEIAALKSKGGAQAEQGEYGAALRTFDRGLQLAPGDAGLHEMRAQVLNEVGRSWDSVQAASAAIKLAPEWAEAHLTLARAQLNYGEPSLALAHFDEANHLKPGVCPEQELAEARVLAKQMAQQGGPGRRAHVGQQGQAADDAGEHREEPRGGARPGELAGEVAGVVDEEKGGDQVPAKLSKRRQAGGACSSSRQWA